MQEYAYAVIVIFKIMSLYEQRLEKNLVKGSQFDRDEWMVDCT